MNYNKKIFDITPECKNHPRFKKIYFIKNYITNNNIQIGDYTYYFANSEQEAVNFQNANILYQNFINNDYLKIGSFCSIANNVKFILNGANHNYNNFSNYPFFILKKYVSNSDSPKSSFYLQKGGISIGHDVWLGYNSLILPGVEIGTGAVIGANCVVSKNIPPYAIAVGNPVKIIKYRFSSDRIKSLLESEWWSKSISEILSLSL